METVLLEPEPRRDEWNRRVKRQRREDYREWEDAVIEVAVKVAEERRP